MLKHPNKTVNLQAQACKNRDIVFFFYTIYQELKLQYRPALPIMYSKENER